MTFHAPQCCNKPMIWQPAAQQYFCPACKRTQSKTPLLRPVKW
jgi:hypothetical protein